MAILYLGTYTEAEKKAVGRMTSWTFEDRHFTTDFVFIGGSAETEAINI